MSRVAESGTVSRFRHDANLVVAWIGLLALVFCCLLPAFAWTYPLELLGHFRCQVALFALLMPLAGWQLKSRPLLILSSLLVLFNAWEILPWYLPHARPPASSRPIKILLANLLFSNTEVIPLRDLLQREQPDLVILQELHSHHQSLMRSLSRTFPHQLQPTDGATGIGIWSRLPLTEAKALRLGPADVPSLAVRLPWQGQSLFLLMSHPAAPVHRAAFDKRNAELAAIADLLGQQPGPRLLIGDLNCSPWSPYYRRLLEQTGFHDARKGFGLLPTWPTDLPVPLRIPLDQVLLSPEVEVSDFRLGPPLGSDHLPVLIRLG